MLRAKKLPQVQRRLELDAIGKRLGLKSLDDWYGVSQTDFKKNGGSALLDFHGSLAATVSQIYTDHVWLPFRFEFTPRGYWKEKKNRLQFLEHLGKGLGYTTLEDWYQVQTQQIVENGGGTMLNYYHNSLQKMIKDLYPNHEWRDWRFNRISVGSWKIEKTISDMIGDLETKFHVKKPEDWYRVSLNQVYQQGAKYLIGKYGTLQQVLQKIYPLHQWDSSRFADKNSKASQRFLLLSVQSLLPDEGSLESLKFSSNRRFQSS